MAGFAVPLCLLAAGALLRLAGRGWALGLVLLAWSGTLGLYLAESGARLVEWRQERRVRREKIRYAAERGAVFDLRSQGEFILALRAKGTMAYPAFPRGQAIAAGLRGGDGRPLTPLGSIANVTTVYGNESGEFLVYRSDEHGFHNPPGLWALEKLDAALVGDSFAHGASVPSASNLAAMVRLRYPATLNLGHAGNGPLSELGTILEYLPPRRPRLVLWAFCVGNDVAEDLQREKGSAELRGYMARPPRLQQLERRQAEIDRLLRAYVDAHLTPAAPEESGFSLPGWLALEKLRNTLRLLRDRPQADFKTLATVLETARDAVAGWGGRLVFVYVPIPGSLREGRYAGWRAESLEVCRRLGIPVLDIEKRFAEERERFDDYLYPYPGHYSETGYRRAGQMIVEELEKHGLQ